MDKDRIKGKVKQAEGSAMKGVGKMTGSTSDQIDGSLKKAEGKIQEKVGKAKDAIRKSR